MHWKGVSWVVDWQREFGAYSAQGRNRAQSCWFSEQKVLKNARILICMLHLSIRLRIVFGCQTYSNPKVFPWSWPKPWTWAPITDHILCAAKRMWPGATWVSHQSAGITQHPPLIPGHQPLLWTAGQSWVAIIWEQWWTADFSLISATSTDSFQASFLGLFLRSAVRGLEWCWNFWWISYRRWQIWGTSIAPW